MKIALIFPGQGSQYIGMGKSLYDASPRAKEMYHRASEILGRDIGQVSFAGPESELIRTINTQPAVFVHSCVMLQLAREAGLTFDFVAGHSLGEYSALVAAGVFTFEDGLAAVGERALLMQTACDDEPGTMAAVLGLDFHAVRDVCGMCAGVVVAANYNAERTIIISGTKEAVTEASELVREAGARRVFSIPVGGAFHSPLMETAPPKLNAKFDQITFTDAHKPVLINVTAEPTSDAQIIRSQLIAQLTAPVLWYPTMMRLMEFGVERLIEIGPKTVLSKLAKPVFPDAEIISLDTADDLVTWKKAGSTVAVSQAS